MAGKTALKSKTFCEISHTCTLNKKALQKIRFVSGCVNILFHPTPCFTNSKIQGCRQQVCAFRCDVGRTVIVFYFKILSFCFNKIINFLKRNHSSLVQVKLNTVTPPSYRQNINFVLVTHISEGHLVNLLKCKYVSEDSFYKFHKWRQELGKTI